MTDRANNSQANNKSSRKSDSFSSKDLVKTAFDAALEKKATDIMALDMKELLVVTDYFVLATGNNELQVKAIATEIEKQLLKECGVKPKHREGEREAKWILLDYDDIVVHIFQPDFRDEYRLEDLWSQAKKLRAAQPCTTQGSKVNATDKTGEADQSTSSASTDASTGAPA